MILTFALVLPLLSLVGLILAYLSYRLLPSPDVSDDPSESDAALVRETVSVYLRRGAIVLLAVCVVAVPAVGRWLTFGTAACFAVGAAISAVAVLVCVLIAARAARASSSAIRGDGYRGAVESAFRGGTACGLTAGSLSLLLLSVGYALTLRGALDPVELAGLILGATAVSLFSRLSGGVFSKAGRLAAHLIGRLEPGVIKDQLRNPAGIADKAGSRVGNLCSAVAELSELSLMTVVATLLIASSGLSTIANITSENRIWYMSLPVIVAGLGLAASIACLFARYLMPRKWDAASGFRLCHLIAAVLLLVASFLVVHALEIEPGVFYALLLGVVSAQIVGLLTEWYVSGPPVRRIAQASQMGSVTTILAGLTVGMQSTALPVLTISGAILIAYNYAGIYGIGMASLGMLSTMSMVLTVASFGSVIDAASGVERVQDTTETGQLTRLQFTGSTMTAVGKSLVLAASGLSALALLSVYARVVGLPSLDLIHPTVIVGFLLGGVLPFVLSDGIITSIGKATFSALEESRRQFDQSPGLRNGTERPEYRIFAVRLTWVSIREILLPLFVAIASPVLIGQILGRATLGGMLAGALVTALLLGFFMIQSGSAWSLTRQLVMAEGSVSLSGDQYAAVVTGELVGDPFKDACGPSVAVLIRLMAITALVIAPLLT